MYEAIRQALITGRIAPGKGVSLRSLAAELSVSPMPVRDAVRRLVAERALAIARATEHYRTPFLPQDVIVIGDTPADVACARAVGAVAVAVETGFCEPGELKAAQPDYLLRDLTEFDRVPV